MKRAKSLVTSIGIVLALPVAVYIIMELLLTISGAGHIISSTLDVRNLIRGAGISAVICFALSMNLNSGRMDMSLGSQRIAATILGGLLAQRLGLGGVWVLIFALILGLIFGGVAGILFVTLRIPPMVLGLGVACIYEALAFAGSGGVGLRLAGTQGATLLADSNFTIIVIAIVTVFMLVLMTYTKFSYQFRAVQGSQKIARDAGINVFVNVALCYMVGGGLVGIAGVLDTAFAGTMNASMGLTSNGPVLSQLFGMMLGCSLMARYVNQAVGVISAAFALRIFYMGLTTFRMSEAMNSSINMLMFIVLLVYLANSHVLAQRRADNKRIAEAQAMKKSHAKAQSM